MRSSERAPSSRRTADGGRRTASIVIDNKDYARFLGDAIGSALDQSVPVEVIVVDDGSTDGSREVIASYGDRVTAVLHETSRGQGAAVNSGFAASTGDVVLFLDSDDRLSPTAAEEAVRAVREGAASVHFPLRVIDAEGRPTGELVPDGRPLPAGDLVPRLLHGGVYRTPPMSGHAYARRALEAVLPVPEADWRLCADSWLFLLAAFEGPVAAIDRPLGDYRVHGRNGWTSSSADVARLRETGRWDRLREAAVLERSRQKGLVAAQPTSRYNAHRAALRVALDVLDDGDVSVRDAVEAVFRDPEPEPWRRAALLAWFAGARILPRSAARTLATWQQFPATRPWRQ